MIITCTLNLHGIGLLVLARKIECSLPAASDVDSLDKKSLYKMSIFWLSSSIYRRSWVHLESGLAQTT